MRRLTSHSLIRVSAQVPNMPWRELILHLDYPGFILPSPEGLSLIMTAYNMACREPFPLECVHLAWANPRGQVRQWDVDGCAELCIFKMVVQWNVYIQDTIDKCMSPSMRSLDTVFVLACPQFREIIRGSF